VYEKVRKGRNIKEEENKMLSKVKQGRLYIKTLRKGLKVDQSVSLLCFYSSCE